MKLIDLLVQELPKFGGWPEGGIEHLHHFLKRNKLTFFANHHYSYFEDWDGNQVTRDQYEAALAASKAPAWNGEGLPPVGVECEWLASGDHGWLAVTVLVYDGKDACLKPSDGTQSFVVGNVEGFRPIRTESDRKRERAVEALSQLVEYRHGCGHMPMARWIYDAIAAGKIPGVKLEDAQ